MKLAESLPELSKEIVGLLVTANEPAFAAQVDGLEIVDRCRCEDDFCSSFYTDLKSKGAYGPSHRTIVLQPVRGMVLLDVVQEKIIYVEVLYRDDVKSKLIKLFP